MSKKEAYARKRREASLAVQAKFKEKLMARTPELVKQVQQSRAAAKNRQPPAASSTAAATAPAASPAARTAAGTAPTNAARQPAPHGVGGQRDQDGRNDVDGGAGGGHVVEILVGLIAVVVAAVLYRRSAFFQKLLFGDEDDAEVDQLF